MAQYAIVYLQLEDGFHLQIQGVYLHLLVDLELLQLVDHQQTDEDRER